MLVFALYSSTSISAKEVPASGEKPERLRVFE
jgi:hypothetical protein